MSVLKNASFEEGHHYQNNISELVVPDKWHLHYLNDERFPGIGNPPAYRPESVTWYIEDAPSHERELYFLDGDYCLKVFKPWAPVYFALTQRVEGLTPGKRYRFTANVFPDIVKDYSGDQKIRPDDIWAAEARAGWSAPDTPWPRGQDPSGGQGITWSDWFNKANGTLEFGAYGDVTVTFTAPDSGEVRVWLECKAKWGFENNWFMDAFSLVPVGEGPGDEEDDEDESTEEGEGGEATKPRGAPRIDYARTYVLLPKDVSREMATAAMRAVYATKNTVGFSADDAGIGDLDQRRVVCVNPQNIGEGLTQDWYEEHYPGVEFDAVESEDPDTLERKLKDKL
jgi:hypothetical protein